jgi:L,D-transpeptidase YbiS
MRRAVAVTLAVAAGAALWSMGVTYSEYSAAGGAPDGANETAAERTEKRTLANRLRRMMPSRRFVVIDHTHNRLYLREGNRVVLDALCSTGSGFVLTDGKHRWVFDTPIGKFSVQTKLTNPVWRKPDWAFVEEGLEIPTDPSERFERGALGEYGLYLGNGYLIHGTLYERLLGRSVTHGCIRVGRDDLRLLYRSVDVGTPVYIY